jgi:hypothetical protein
MQSSQKRLWHAEHAAKQEEQWSWPHAAHWLMQPEQQCSPQLWQEIAQSLHSVESQC